MKIGKLGLATALTAALFMTQCKPKTPNTEPVADTETETAVDAAWATYMVADIEQLCAFIGEEQYYENFYVPADPNSKDYEPVKELNAEQKFVTWRNGPILCRDGRKREGSIFLYTFIDKVANPDADLNSRYYRDYGFVGNISFGNYFVDGWEVKLQDDGNRMFLYNQRKTKIYTREQVLTFKLKGKVIFKHPTDESKDITWEGELYKQITNSVENDIFDVKAQKPINWFITDTKTGKVTKAAICKYYGSSFGMTSGRKPYKMEIKPETPLVRDYMCTSDPVASVAASTGTTGFSFVTDQHHPFIGGIASFTTGTSADNKYPRQIYFGNESTPEQPVQCDITGVINIKGNYYPINFRK